MAEPPMSIQWQLTAKKPIKSSPLGPANTGVYMTVLFRCCPCTAAWLQTMTSPLWIFSRP